ncbi:hypothetical protein CR513_36199, partial [Mucuna pruriens]
MVTGKSFTKRSPSKGKSFTKSSCGEYCMYCKRSEHTKDTCYKLYGKEKFHKASESLILGQHIILSRFLHILHHTLKYPKSNSLLLLMEIMFLLLGLATSNFSPLYPYTMLIQNWNCAATFFRSYCVIQELTMGRMIGVAKEQDGLYYLQHTKVGNNTNKEDVPSSQRGVGPQICLA